MKAGTQEGRRTWSLVPARKRRRCTCCGKRASHFGLGSGVVLMSGCEWYVRMWCRSPGEAAAFVARQRRTRDLAALASELRAFGINVE